jgi:hypothetical protein
MDFSKKTKDDLKAICKQKSIKGYSAMKRADLIQLLQATEVSSAEDEKKVEEYDVTVVLSADDEKKEEVEEKKEHVEEMRNVLEICKIPNSLNIEQMKELIKEYMEGRKKFYQSTNRPCMYEDEFSEYHTAICTHGKTIGGGSCGMDVKTGMSEGIDAMCVIMNKTQSNEKSLMQNFSESGENLDHLFHEKDDATAVGLFVEGYSKKLLKCKTEKDLTELYILAFISTHTEVHMTCFNINIENLKNVSSGGFVGDKYVNIIVNGFINSAYGNVRLYKSKKRMELRLHHAILQHEHTVKIYSME